MNTGIAQPWLRISRKHPHTDLSEAENDSHNLLPFHWHLTQVAKKNTPQPMDVTGSRSLYD